MAPRALPVLRPGRRPRPGQWYRLSLHGERPCGRVGHGCLFLPGVGPGRVLLLGGADPDGAFADAHFVELGTHRWVATSWTGLRPRYEHATILPTTRPVRLWVFGGAHPAGNRSCIQVLDPEIGTWESPEVSGIQPLPRTFHTSSAAVGERLYVFGGGDKGAEPVVDQQLHVFDTGLNGGGNVLCSRHTPISVVTGNVGHNGSVKLRAEGRCWSWECFVTFAQQRIPFHATLTWSQPDTRGDPPSPRHGHVMVAIGTKLFIHGGLAGDVFHSDLFCIDIDDMQWVKVAATGDIPGGRASHAAAAFKEQLYIFGGIGPSGALDTMYRYHTEKQQWTLLQFDAPLPAARLDHAVCVIPWRIARSTDVGAANREGRAREETNVSAGDKAAPLEKGQDEERDGALVHLLWVFGGMNTQGEVYRDCIVTLVE